MPTTKCAAANRCKMQDAGCRVNSCLLLLASCFLLLASCSFPGSARPTVKIGLVAPFEGRYRYVGYDVIYAVRLALREANAAGGVAGYYVELVAYDDGADPAQAAEQARKLAVDPSAVAAIGHFREETTEAAISVYAEAGIPLVAPAVLDPTLARGVADELLGRLEKLELDRAALVTKGGPLGVAIQENAGRLYIATEIWPVVSPEGVDWVNEVLASGAEVVFCDADPVTAGEVIAALREAGWEGAFLGGPELAAADFAAVAGEAAEGTMFVTSHPFPADAPGGADFIAAYQTVSNSVPPGPLALPAYEATWTLLESLERDIAAHGKPTREGIGTFSADSNRNDTPLYWYQIGADGIARLITDRP
ncbi:MAG: branched-chain amino acid ABC transporter substrate-binding protein [Chloroflexi bacterium]|nr:branched-chain amino acid ABC transporter substrate-binding protein [Chloroflexota bacterium]